MEGQANRCTSHPQRPIVVAHYPESFPRILRPTSNDVARERESLDTPLPDFLVNERSIERKRSRVRNRLGRDVPPAPCDTLSELDRMYGEVLSFLAAGNDPRELPDRSSQETAAHYALRIQLATARRSLLADDLIDGDEMDTVLLPLPLMVSLVEEDRAREAAGLCAEELADIQIRIGEPGYAPPPAYHRFASTMRSGLYRPRRQPDQSTMDLMTQLAEQLRFTGHRDDLDFMRIDLARAQATAERERQRHARSEGPRRASG